MPSHKIAIVVDQAFGSKLHDIAQHIHVWICATPANLQSAQTARAQLKQERQWNEQGVTTFRVSANETAEEMIINRLPEIDLHHNEYSHDPAWSEIEVYGVGPTPQLQQELGEYGVVEFNETPEGFICWRPESTTG